MTSIGLIAIAAAIIMCASVIIGFSEALVAIAALKAMGRNPEAADKLRTNMIIAMSIVETGAIYGLVIALLIIFYLGGMAV